MRAVRKDVARHSAGQTRELGEGMNTEPRDGTDLHAALMWQVESMCGLADLASGYYRIRSGQADALLGAR